ncbi:MAG: NADH-quinone oxidoreductase subunit C [Neomegalonema sp.]|nr:NADH-quinone oxidoreductase subunit C [Neomegalonema sp.]
MAQTLGQGLHDLAEIIETALGDAFVSAQVVHDELTVHVARSQIATAIETLRENSACQFTSLIDLTGVDYPGRERRFDVVYHLLSMPQNQRVRVVTQAREDEAVPSITEVFPVANWFEREAFDMYGIIFSGHPDLRRILTDYGFRGYPLRKDFPTTGYTEVRYDETAKRVVYEPVTLVQEYRQFDFLSPWESAQYVLPGDEKKDG